MEEKGQALPPSYEAAYGISNPSYDTYSPSNVELGGAPPVQQYGYPQSVYGHTVVTQQPIATYNQVAMVPDNMGLAILAIFCCWPLGIAAIMKASDSRAALARNDIPTAMSDATDAKRYSCLGIGFGIFFLIVAIIVIVVVFETLNVYSY